MPLTDEQRAAVEQARALADRLQANTIAPSWHTVRPTDDMYRASQAIQHLAGVIDALLAENAILRIDLNEWREVANDRLQAECGVLNGIIRELDAKNAALREALAALATAVDDHYDLCLMCGQRVYGEHELHAPDCPVARARALLKGVDNATE